MKRRLTTIPRITLAIAVLALVAAPAFALLEPVIDNGSDIWQTRPDGTSFVKFEADPLPADFFCTGSQPFAGRIVMGGVPLATEPASALGPTDTIVQRLDDAVFDENGVAVSRLQVKAIQLRSAQPFRNSCGAFEVRVSLAEGEQPIGEMRIVRQGAGFGYYESDVALNVKISFTPIDHQGQTLEVVRHVDFPANRNYWTSRPGEGGVQYDGFVRVDTDANGQADTFIPGTSRNFAPGWARPEESIGILRRGAASEHGLDVSGSLKGAPGPIQVTPQLGVRGLGGAALAVEEKTTIGTIDCSSSSCHCDEDGDHCQTATVALE
jgi:hypothetical protein